MGSHVHIKAFLAFLRPHQRKATQRSEGGEPSFVALARTLHTAITPIHGTHSMVMSEKPVKRTGSEARLREDGFAFPTGRLVVTVTSDRSRLWSGDR